MVRSEERSVIVRRAKLGPRKLEMRILEAVKRVYDFA